MTDMKQVYDDFMIINLYTYLHMRKWLLRSSVFLQTFLILFDYFDVNSRSGTFFQNIKLRLKLIYLN